MTLKDLSILDWEQRCSQTKMPKEYIPKNTYTDKTANGLTKAVIRFLTLHNCQAERISNTGRYIEGAIISKGFYGTSQAKGKFIPGGGKNGTADISATIRGRSVKLEVKIGRDRQSEAQKNYQEEVEAAGGKYFLVHNWEEFYGIYTSLINEFS